MQSCRPDAGSAFDNLDLDLDLISLAEAMVYMCAKFGFDNSCHFSFNARTDKRTDPHTNNVTNVSDHHSL